MIYKTKQNRNLRNTVVQALCCCLAQVSFIGMAQASDDIDIASDILSFDMLETIKYDHNNLYSGERLARLGIAFSLGGILANTGIDERIHTDYQSKILSSSTNDISAVAKNLGEGYYLVPLSLLASSFKYIDNTSVVGAWGARSARAYLTGLPAMWLMQRVTGGSRPEERNSASRWNPFQDDNGVSGHSFVGTVPFLTIAKMNPDNNWIKYAAYVASTAAGWSRVNDGAHYFSQATLGWYMAWESVNAVHETEEKIETATSVVPLISGDTIGLTFFSRW